MVAENSAFSPDCYMTVLKAKQAEMGALAGIDPASKARLVPLVEARDPARLVESLSSAWNVDDVVFVHPLNVDSVDDGTWLPAVEDLFAGLRARGVQAVPVVTVDDAGPTSGMLRAVLSADGRGACVRLDAEELAVAAPGTTAADVGHLLTDLGVGFDECDLVVDVGLVRETVGARVATAEAALRVVPSLSDWRNVVVAFSAFPSNLGEWAAKSDVTQIIREDARSFAALLARGLDRAPVYGDYAIGFPFYADVPWGPIPAIRYAAGEAWMVHRGYSRQNRSPQYIGLARDVVAAPYFAGAGVSAGDEYLAGVAAGVDGPGNPMTYLRAGVSRHIACVLDRLATLGVP